jgi:hypothetical protein
MWLPRLRAVPLFPIAWYELGGQAAPGVAWQLRVAAAAPGASAASEHPSIRRSAQIGVRSVVVACGVCTLFSGLTRLDAAAEAAAAAVRVAGVAAVAAALAAALRAQQACAAADDAEEDAEWRVCEPASLAAPLRTPLLARIDEAEE